MLDDSIKTRSFDKREEMQTEHGTNIQPLQDLCYCTYILPDRATIICDVIGTDEAETIALLSYVDETTSPGKRRIWVANRDQAGTPGTWRWTPEQMEAAKKNPVRIDDPANDFRGESTNEQRIQIAPIHKDRRIEILMLGLQLPKTDDEVREQLRAEGLDGSLPKNYRTEQGELDLLKNWLPQKKNRT
jgi:hypothetical protein